MDAGIIGIVAACFVALTAGKLGHEWGKGSAELGLAALAFTLSIALPPMTAAAGEDGFLITGAIFAALGAYLLFRAATKIAAP